MYMYMHYVTLPPLRNCLHFCLNFKIKGVPFQTIMRVKKWERGYMYVILKLIYLIIAPVYHLQSIFLSHFESKNCALYIPVAMVAKLSGSHFQTIVRWQTMRGVLIWARQSSKSFIQFSDWVLRIFDCYCVFHRHLKLMHCKEKVKRITSEWYGGQIL